MLLFTKSVSPTSTRYCQDRGFLSLRWRGSLRCGNNSVSRQLFQADEAAGGHKDTREAKQVKYKKSNIRRKMPQESCYKYMRLLGPHATYNADIFTNVFFFFLTGICRTLKITRNEILERTCYPKRLLGIKSFTFLLILFIYLCCCCCYRFQ